MKWGKFKVMFLTLIQWPDRGIKCLRFGVSAPKTRRGFGDDSHDNFEVLGVRIGVFDLAFH